MTTYKYYFKKPRSEIVKDILSWVAMVGVIYIAANSPYFILNVMREFKKRNIQRKGFIIISISFKKMVVLRLEKEIIKSILP